MTTTPNTEQEAFEAWYHTEVNQGEVFAKHSVTFLYDDWQTQRCWLAWNAAQAQPIPVAGSNQVMQQFLTQYYKAVDTSQSEDWIEAALLAKQWHCTIEQTVPTASVEPSAAWVNAVAKEICVSYSTAMETIKTVLELQPVPAASPKGDTK